MVGLSVVDKPQLTAAGRQLCHSLQGGGVMSRDGHMSGGWYIWRAEEVSCDVHVTDGWYGGLKQSCDGHVTDW